MAGESLEPGSKRFLPWDIFGYPQGVRGRALLTVVALLSALVAAPAQASPGSAGLARRTAASVPSGFVGMMADGPVFYEGFPLGQQLARMASSGVERVRVEFNWRTAQPVRSWAELPSSGREAFVRGPGGVPTSFLATDQIVSAAARHHLALLPVVIQAPLWDASPLGNHIQPRHDSPYAGYLTALVRRYGPKGTFWKAHRSIPRRPITAWQVWDEPNIGYFWDSLAWVSSYISLLRAASHAIRHADPRAEVVLGSLSGDSTHALALVYHHPRVRRLFDAVAVNVYSRTAGGVIDTLRAVRGMMDRQGDRSKPLIATELGWPSGLGKTILGLGVSTTTRGQAQKVSQLLPLLAASRRAIGLQSFFYYTWISTDQVGAYSPFAFAGLLSYDVDTHRIQPKPALAVFRKVVLRLEGRR